MQPLLLTGGKSAGFSPKCLQSAVAAFKGDRATHDEARAMLDRMVELQKLWDDALVDAAKTKAGNYCKRQHAGIVSREVLAARPESAGMVAFEPADGKRTRQRQTIS